MNWRAFLSHPPTIECSAVALACAWCAQASAAYAEAPVDFAASYTADYVAALSGAHASGNALDNLDLSAAFDLNALAGWRNTTAFVHVLNNSGDSPNDVMATLQGVDSIEVARHRARLYEAWLETQIGAVNVRGGLYDLNSEFYANDAASLLISPAFGIGSELAATGPNGPSIFPSTALALRAAMTPSAHTEFKVAALNANAGVLGDPGGVDTTFDHGALLIGEWSWTGATHISVGGWAYTDQQDDIRAAGQRRASGAYVTLQRSLVKGVTGFARVGISDGDTTPYGGGWQAGLLLDHVIAGRPDSQLSMGAYQGRLDAKQRANARDSGVNASAAETGVELTYSDQLTPWLRLQPDLQLVLDPAGDRDRADLWVAGLRIVITPFAASTESGA